MPQSLAARIGLALMSLWFMNVLMFYLFGTPTLYCLALPGARSLYITCGTMILYVSMGAALYGLLRHRMKVFLMASIAAFVIIELPNVADHLLRMGGSCA